MANGYQAPSADSHLSGSNVMVPAPLPQGKKSVGMATAPAVTTMVERPSYVVINNTGSYHFCYQSTASLGGTVTGSDSYADGDDQFILAGNFKNDGDDSDSVPNVRLDIQPVAWSGSGDGDNYLTGDVTFVYKKGQSNR